MAAIRADGYSIQTSKTRINGRAWLVAALSRRPK